MIPQSLGNLQIDEASSQGRTAFALGAQNYSAGKKEQSKKMPTVYKSQVDTMTAEQHVHLISLLQKYKASAKEPAS